MLIFSFLMVFLIYKIHSTFQYIKEDNKLASENDWERLEKNKWHVNSIFG